MLVAVLYALCIGPTLCCCFKYFSPIIFYFLCFDLTNQCVWIFISLCQPCYDMALDYTKWGDNLIINSALSVEEVRVNFELHCCLSSAGQINHTLTLFH